MNEYKEVPYKVLNFICAEINYGGRVTDAKDLRLIKSLLENYLCSRVLKDNYKFSNSGDYTSLPVGALSDYVEKIQTFSLVSSPEVFLLHDNAEITTNENNAQEFIVRLMEIQSSSEANSDRNNKYQEIIELLESKVPEMFNYKEVRETYPTDYSESMNTVLI